jgi:hypothetical protein
VKEFDYDVSIVASGEVNESVVSEGELVLVKAFLADILKELLRQASNDKE